MTHLISLNLSRLLSLKSNTQINFIGKEPQIVEETMNSNQWKSIEFPKKFIIFLWTLKRWMGTGNKTEQSGLRFGSITHPPNTLIITKKQLAKTMYY